MTHRLEAVLHGSELEVWIHLLEEVVASRLLELSVRLTKQQHGVFCARAQATSKSTRQN